MFRRFPKLYRSLYSLYKAVSDKDELSLIQSVVTSGMTVLDIGANIGIYTHYLLQLVGPAGEVHAFEPHPVNFHLLSQTFSNCKNVFLNESAVGKDNLDLSLFISPFLNVDHRTYPSGDERDVQIVHCTSMDNYLDESKQVDFIKMDIQGYEFHALLGMERILRDNDHVKLLLEYVPKGLEASGYSGSELRSFLVARGFSLFSMSGKDRLKPLHEEEPKLNSLGYTNIYAQRDLGL